MTIDAKNFLLFSLLTNKFHEKSRDDFLKSLPSSLKSGILKHELSAQTKPSLNLSLLLIDPEEQIKKIHYSWLLEPFNNFPTDFKGSLLASLNEGQRKILIKKLNLEENELKIAPLFKRFLTHLFYLKLEKKEILPTEFLQDHKLSCLLTFSKQQIVAIIDYLGIYDLAEEIRHIIEKNLLKSIYSAISPKKQKFLKETLNQKEKFLAPKLDLKSWDKEKESLEKILHKRGLIRFNQALGDAENDFIWHIAHILDIGRGSFILQQKKEKVKEKTVVINTLTEQVINVINFLNIKSHHE